MAVIRSDGSVSILEADTGAEVVQVVTEETATCAAFHPFQARIAIGTTRGVEVHDLTAPDKSASKHGLHHVRHLTWSPDGRTVTYISLGQRLVHWDPDSGVSAVAPGIGGFLATVCQSPDGRWIADCNDEGLLTIRNPKSFKPLAENLSGFPHRFDTDGRRLLCLTQSGGVRSYEISPSECFTEFEVPFFGDPSLPGIALSPDGRWLAATSYSSGVFVWNLDKGGLPAFSPFFGCASIAFNAGGDEILACSEQGVFVWPRAAAGEEPVLGEPRLLIGARVESSYRLTWTRSSPARIIVPSDKNNWAIHHGDFSDFLPLPSQIQQSAALSPDGRWLA